MPKNRILAVVGEKGGTGKSTTAQSIAVYFKKHQNKDVMVVDADLPQKTTADWADARNKNKDIDPINIVEKTGDLRPTLLELSRKYDVVIVDCGGQDSEAMRSTLSVAHVAILPFRPKRRDLKNLPSIEKIIRLAQALNEKLIVRALITQCPSLPTQADRIQMAKSVCESFDILPLNNVTFHRNAYDDCDENGLTVFEFSDEKAKEEMINICDEVLGVINSISKQEELQ